MPRATVSHEYKEHELSSCPGGWVKLRKLTYEEVLVRRDGATRLSMEAEQANQQPKENGDQKQKLELETIQVWSRKFEFRSCIVDHNLEDDKGQKLDFNNPMTFKMLDLNIAYEIERLIDKINGEDAEEALKDFMSVASGLSEATISEHGASEES